MLERKKGRRKTEGRGKKRLFIAFRHINNRHATWNFPSVKEEPNSPFFLIIVK